MVKYCSSGQNQTPRQWLGLVFIVFGLMLNALAAEQSGALAGVGWWRDGSRAGVICFHSLAAAPRRRVSVSRCAEWLRGSGELFDRVRPQRGHSVGARLAPDETVILLTSPLRHY